MGRIQDGSTALWEWRARVSLVGRFTEEGRTLMMNRQLNLFATATIAVIAAMAWPHEAAARTVVCQGNRSMTVTNQTLDGVVARDNCELTLVSCTIRAGGIGLMAADNAAVALHNSDLSGMQLAIRARNNATVTVKHSAVRGAVRVSENGEVKRRGARFFPRPLPVVQRRSHDRVHVRGPHHHVEYRRGHARPLHPRHRPSAQGAELTAGPRGVRVRAGNTRVAVGADGARIHAQGNRVLVGKRGTRVHTRGAHVIARPDKVRVRAGSNHVSVGKDGVRISVGTGR